MNRSHRLLAAVLAAAASVIARPAAAQRPDTALARPLTLGDAARLAARQNAGAVAARYRADEAAARITQARGAFLPNLSAYALENGRSFNTATFGITLPGFPSSGEVISGVNIFDVRGRISQNVLDLGAVQRIRGARSAATAATADATNAAEIAGATAAVAYLGAQRADALVEARLADSVLADSLVGIAREQLRAGVGVALDVTRAQAQAAAVRAQLIATRNARDRAQLDLRRALGVPLDARVMLADSLRELPITDTLPNESDALALAMRQRPDLRAAAAQLQAARQQISAIRAERLPTLSVFGDEGWIGSGFVNHLLNTYTWNVQLSLPLFDGGQREARIEEQRAVANEADVRRRDLLQQAAVDVRGALLDLASAREQVDASRERLRLAQEEYTEARDRFRAGVAGNADVITAGLSLNDSRTQLVDALTSYQSARVTFARAEGTVTALP